MNPLEPRNFPLGRWNLYIGGAGRTPPGYVNLDLVAMPGVHVAADAESLPFPAGVFARVECDAVLEHVRHPERVLAEIHRVLAARRVCPPGHAVLPSVPRVSARLSPLHAGRAQRTRGPARTRRRRLAHRAHGHHAGVHHRVRQTAAAVACVARGGARRARMAAVSAAVSGPAARSARAARDASAITATSGCASARDAPPPHVPPLHAAARPAQVRGFARHGKMGTCGCAFFWPCWQPV